MKIFAFTFVLLMATYVAIGQAEDTPLNGMPSGLYKLDKSHASMIWKVNHLGLSNYTARFADFDIDLDFQAQDVEKSRVRATIDPTSITTDHPNPEKKDFDKELSKNAGWFNTDQFPSITFKSSKVTKTSDKTGKITGDLTFLGKTKPITLDVVFNKAMGNHPMVNKPALGFSATTSLKRSDFGMTRYLPQIGDKVDVIIEAEFHYAN